ncbi:hypothetical protein M9458_020093, partial [Cirrhinus mrigala]
MEGNRGVLVEQQITTEENNILRLTVNLSSHETDPLHWHSGLYNYPSYLINNKCSKHIN